MSDTPFISIIGLNLRNVSLNQLIAPIPVDPVGSHPIKKQIALDLVPALFDRDDKTR